MQKQRKKLTKAEAKKLEKKLEKEILKEFPSKGTLLEAEAINKNEDKLEKAELKEDEEFAKQDLSNIEADELAKKEEEEEELKKAFTPTPSSHTTQTFTNPNSPNSSGTYGLPQVGNVSSIASNPAKYKLPNQISTREEAQEAVLSVLETLATPASRKGIMAVINNDHSITKSGGKTKSGRVRWKVAVDWAISKLKADGTIKRVGKNAYSLDPNATTVHNMPNVTPQVKALLKKARTIMGKQIKAQSAASNITLQPVKTKQVSAVKQAKKQIEDLRKQIRDEINSKTTPKDKITKTKVSGIKESDFEQVEIKNAPTPATTVVHQHVHTNAPVEAAKAVKQEVKEEEQEGEKDGDLFIQNKPDPYYGEKDLEDILKAMAKGNFKIPLLLEGEKGVGKTSAVWNFAYKTKIPIITIQCNKDTTDLELIGHLEQKEDGSTKFEIGELPRAVEKANQYGTAILLIDEINALRPEYQKALNSLVDNRKAVYGAKRAWNLDEKSNLIIIATQNPSTYAGTFELNEELKDRFAIEYTDFPDPALETKILMDATSDKEVIKNLILLAQFTRKRAKDDPESGFYTLTPRGLKYVCKTYESFKAAGHSQEDSLRLALKVFVRNKYLNRPADYDAMKNKIYDIFKIKV